MCLGELLARLVQAGKRWLVQGNSKRKACTQSPPSSDAKSTVQPSVQRNEKFNTLVEALGYRFASIAIDDCVCLLASIYGRRRRRRWRWRRWRWRWWRSGASYTQNPSSNEAESAVEPRVQTIERVEAKAEAIGYGVAAIAIADCVCLTATIYGRGRQCGWWRRRRLRRNRLR